MGIQQVPLASSGLSASDLITSPDWTLISKVTTGSNTFSSTSFSSIPSNYRRLRLSVRNIVCSPGQGWFLWVRLNGDSSINYFSHARVLRTTTTGQYGWNGVDTAWSIGGNGIGNGQPIGADYIINNANDTSGTSKFGTAEAGWYDGGYSYHQRNDTTYEQSSPSAITSISITNDAAANFTWSSSSRTTGFFLYGAN